MIELVGQYPWPEYIEESIVELFYSKTKDYIIVITASWLLFYNAEGKGLVNSLNIGGRIICSIQMDKNIIVGLESGEICIIERDSLNIIQKIMIKENSGIRCMKIDDVSLYLLLGMGTIVRIEMQELDDYLKGDSSWDMLLEWCCYYETPNGNVVSSFLVPSEDKRTLGWPEQEFHNTNVKMLLVGSKPMSSIVSLSPITDAILDPVAQAAGFVTGKISGWFGGSDSPKKALQLFDKLPLGTLTIIMSMDDSDRTINSIIPFRDLFLLHDQKHGRELLFDQYLGIVTRQVKGLRGCKISICDDQDILIAYNEKRGHIQILAINSGEMINQCDTATNGLLVKSKDEIFLAAIERNTNDGINPMLSLFSFQLYTKTKSIQQSVM